MSKLERLNSLLHRLGYDLSKYNKGTSAVLRRKAVLEKYKVDLIIDVGANTGIYGKEVRKAGYTGRIVSFEPLNEAFSRLSATARNYRNWDVYNFALGEKNEKQKINISANSHSSSILDILDAHTTAESSASYVGTQEIEIKTLDSVFDEVRGKNDREIFAKIDTQGFELSVLRGAENSLSHINTVQLEMSLRPLYQGQGLYSDILDHFHSRGYTLIDVDPGFADLKTGTLLQFDGVFRRAAAGY